MLGFPRGTNSTLSSRYASGVVVYLGTSSWTSRTASASESGSSSPRIQSGVCVRSARRTTHHVMTPSVVAPNRWAPFSRSDIVELRSMKESPVRHDALAIARNSTEHRCSVLIRELDTGSRLMIPSLRSLHAQSTPLARPHDPPPERSHALYCFASQFAPCNFDIVASTK